MGSQLEIPESSAGNSGLGTVLQRPLGSSDGVRGRSEGTEWDTTKAGASMQRSHKTTGPASTTCSWGSQRRHSILAGAGAPRRAGWHGHPSLLCSLWLLSGTIQSKPLALEGILPDHSYGSDLLMYVLVSGPLLP